MKRIWSFLTKWYSFIRCIAVIILHSLIVIGLSRIGKLTRKKVNIHIRKGSIKLLNIVRAKYNIHASGFKFQSNVQYIFMSNHLSLFDIPLIYATLPGTIRIVGKKEIFKIPLLGKALLDAENICIDSRHPDKMLDFYHQAEQALAKGIALWIFPEGTRSKSGELLKFNMGGFRLAREAGAQIIPVGIIGTNKLLPAHTSDLHKGEILYLSVGMPIDSSSFIGIEGQKQLMQKVRDSILMLCHESLYRK